MTGWQARAIKPQRARVAPGHSVRAAGRRLPKAGWPTRAPCLRSFYEAAVRVKLCLRFRLPSFLFRLPISSTTPVSLRPSLSKGRRRTLEPSEPVESADSVILLFALNVATTAPAHRVIRLGWGAISVTALAGIANRMRARRRANATIATRLPRRSARRCTHACSVALLRSDRHTAPLACTSTPRMRGGPAFVIRPRRCRSPELSSCGTTPRYALTAPGPRKRVTVSSAD